MEDLPTAKLIQAGSGAGGFGFWGLVVRDLKV